MKLILDRTNERTALFVDGMHLYAISRALGFDVDYLKLIKLFSHTRLVRANYYSVIIDNEEYTPLRPLTDWLSYNGWCVHTKPGKEFIDTAGKRRVRGTVNVEIARDLFEGTGYLDHAVIIAGDADLRAAVEMVQRRGVRATLISVMQKGGSPMMADELRRQADAFIEISDILPELQRLSDKREPASAH